MVSFQLSFLLPFEGNWLPFPFSLSIQFPISHLFSGYLVFWDQSSVLISLPPSISDFCFCSPVICQGSKRLNGQLYILEGRKETKGKTDFPGMFKSSASWDTRLPSLSYETLFGFWHHLRTEACPGFKSGQLQSWRIIYCEREFFFFFFSGVRKRPSLPGNGLGLTETTPFVNVQTRRTGQPLERGISSETANRN